jgi:hypothetical protein
METFWIVAACVVAVTAIYFLWARRLRTPSAQPQTEEKSA